MVIGGLPQSSALIHGIVRLSTITMMSTEVQTIEFTASPLAA